MWRDTHIQTIALPRVLKYSKGIFEMINPGKVLHKLIFYVEVKETHYPKNIEKIQRDREINHMQKRVTERRTLPHIVSLPGMMHCG